MEAAAGRGRLRKEKTRIMSRREERARQGRFARFYPSHGPGRLIKVSGRACSVYIHQTLSGTCACR